MIGKLPIPCPACREFTMSVDPEQTHQHIGCEKCERVWCAICLGVPIPTPGQYARNPSLFSRN